MPKKETPCYKIERGIRMPKLIAGRHKWPFRDMQVGDSFSVNPDIFARVRSAASYYGIRHKRRYAVIHSEMRCWRVE